MACSLLSDLIIAVSNQLHAPIYDTKSLLEWKLKLNSLIDRIIELKFRPASSIDPMRTSLDPEDWPSARKLAHEILDLSLDHVQFVRDKPVVQIMPETVRTFLEDEPLPKQGLPLASICCETFTNIVPYIPCHPHPRFYGFVKGEGTFGGIISSMIAASTNIVCGASSHSAAAVERVIIHWMREIFGFPKTKNGGLLTSGTSMATIIGMMAARQYVLKEAKENGLAQKQQLVIYASTESHQCIMKTAELMGFGAKAVHWISVDDNFCIKTDELKIAIKNDRERGYLPFCIVGNAGTVNTGAFDDLVELASIAQNENIWFHVDGAFGSLIVLDNSRRHLVNGIHLANSVAFDFHKWLHCPYDVGCVLVRDSSFLQSAFYMNSSYLSTAQQNRNNSIALFCDLGFELSRPFRALKVWFTLREYGIIKLGQKIADNCEQAQYLVSLLEKHETIIRIFRPVLLNIVNFRFVPIELDNISDEKLNLFNNQLNNDILLSGIAVSSTTRILNNTYIRVCIVSHRTTFKDLDIFMETVLKLYKIRLDTFS